MIIFSWFWLMSNIMPRVAIYHVCNEDYDLYYYSTCVQKLVQHKEVYTCEQDELLSWLYMFIIPSQYSSWPILVVYATYTCVMMYISCKYLHVVRSCVHLRALCCNRGLCVGSFLFIGKCYSTGICGIAPPVYTAGCFNILFNIIMLSLIHESD